MVYIYKELSPFSMLVNAEVLCLVYVLYILFKFTVTPYIILRSPPSG